MLTRISKSLFWKGSGEMWWSVVGNSSQGVRGLMLVLFFSIKQTRVCFQDQEKTISQEDMRK